MVCIEYTIADEVQESHFLGLVGRLEHCSGLRSLQLEVAEEEPTPCPYGTIFDEGCFRPICKPPIEADVDQFVEAVAALLAVKVKEMRNKWPMREHKGLEKLSSCSARRRRADDGCELN